ncbi:monooxygenase [Sporosarcina pasteurii]|uniref:Monooxygenase ydhR n=1 Tax=Sporosarcina pasteurii TaxID=1474 RepID=A0A380BW76_SPOPA|nr:monooxygenase [Sporosarcina pasteurii]MDS9471386.1 monooxygenase [Sporosarcina pasteurii]QBQ04986.1 monooxygenase [Sporosarcina pasteurii]SUJ08384.1 Putative monooxygenase ydhR [Sporosarcina pasteurii]
MAYILQVDFKHEGPFGEEMVAAFSDLAKSINEEKGLIWKIWTENEETKEAGGIYLFEMKEDAEIYLDMHTKRLESFGVTNVNAKIFKANDALTAINHGKLK